MRNKLAGEGARRLVVSGVDERLLGRRVAAVGEHPSHGCVFVADVAVVRRVKVVRSHPLLAVLQVALPEDGAAAGRLRRSQTGREGGMEGG
jgi:hypothetical protein